MFIHNTPYYTNLQNVQFIRGCLLRHYTLDIINLIEQYIRRYIDTFDIIYNSFTCSFSIRVKKSTMRKKYNSFKHETIFYYNILKDIFYSFFNENRDLIVRMLRNDFGFAADEVYDNFILNPNKLLNLFQIYCIGNNIIEIRL